jgi:2-(1,2-epoxy-1,2-dihydrophenyl)acetyl-CoA isomerase
MLTSVRERDGERVLTVQFHEPTIDVEVLHQLALVFDGVEHSGIENIVLEFAGGCDSLTGEFPSSSPSPSTREARYFSRWDDTLSRISRLNSKTFVAYDGRIGAAALQAGFVVDLRLATTRTRLVMGTAADRRFAGMGAYWLPKFVGVGQAQRILLLGGDLPAARASSLGIVDVVEGSLDEAVAAALDATRLATPEAAYFTRRLLHDSNWLEQSAAIEQAKAARFKLAMNELPNPRLASALEGANNDRTR